LPRFRPLKKFHRLLRRTPNTSSHCPMNTIKGEEIVPQRVRIAIDGPVASGKSTIGARLAHAVRCLYLDTGVMYRGVTALALDQGINPTAEALVTALAARVQFGFPALDQATQANPPLLADGVDITAKLRLPEVDRHVSAVSSYAGVRQAMVAQQQAIAASRSVVMVGRDIGTVVLPHAEVKIYLVASAEERASRRHQERVAAGIPEDKAQTLADLQRRDRLDMERVLSPLRPADDAVQLDTTGLDREQVLARCLEIIHARFPEV